MIYERTLGIIKIHIVWKVKPYRCVIFCVYLTLKVSHSIQKLIKLWSKKSAFLKTDKKLSWKGALRWINAPSGRLSQNARKFPKQKCLEIIFRPKFVKIQGEIIFPNVAVSLSNNPHVSSTELLELGACSPFKHFPFANFRKTFPLPY